MFVQLCAYYSSVLSAQDFFYSIQVYSSQEYTEKGVLAIVCKSRVSTLLKIDEQECPTQQSMVN